MHQINNFSKMHLDAAFVEIWVTGGVVDELRKFALAHLRRAVAEDEEESVDSVRLARTIRTDDGRERLYI